MSSGSSEILLFVLIVLSMVFSSSETALTTIGKIRLRHMLEEDVKGAKKIEKIMEDPKKLLTTILIGNNIVNIGASALATSIALEKTSDGPFAPYIISIVTFALAFIILVFGEITPKNLAVQNAEKVALIVAPFIEVCIWLFTPFAFVLNVISSGIIKLFGGNPDAYMPSITEAELKTMVNVSQEEGVLEYDEKQMIHNVFDFGDYTAEQIMTPRTDIVAISKNASFDEIIQTFDSEKFSRVPVYNESTDDIIGLLYLKDFIFCNKENFQIEDYLREVFFTYESKPIKQLFSEMRANRNNLAIILDEYGGTQGIVTLEDLVEEIVGEILDENDEEENVIDEINENEFIVQGATKLEDISDDLNIKIESEDFDTIGGYVTGIAGKIPNEKEIVYDDNCEFEIIEVDKNRVEKVKITILDKNVIDSSEDIIE